MTDAPSLRTLVEWIAGLPVETHARIIAMLSEREPARGGAVRLCS